MKKHTALAIAGSDCSGGAGIQADLKTMTVNGVYAMSAVTALTAQNTTGITDICEVSPAFLKAQLDAVFTDIFPDAVKIGMVSSARLIAVIADRLEVYKAEKIVLDPVMVASSGRRLLDREAEEMLFRRLIPVADVVTPNIPEAEVIGGIEIFDKKTMEAAAEKIYRRFGCSVLLKGGHQSHAADDLLYDGGRFQWFYGTRIENPNTHGTGCTLSSAVAAELAKGMSTADAVAHAKEYMTGALSAMLDLGCGSGPLDHAFMIDGSRENCHW